MDQLMNRILKLFIRRLIECRVHKMLLLNNWYDILLFCFFCFTHHLFWLLMFFQQAWEFIIMEAFILLVWLWTWNWNVLFFFHLQDKRSFLFGFPFFDASVKEFYFWGVWVSVPFFNERSKNGAFRELTAEWTDFGHPQIWQKLFNFEEFMEVFLFSMFLTYPKLFVVPHQGQDELEKDIPNFITTEMCILHLLHFEQISALRVLQIFLHFWFIVYF